MRLLVFLILAVSLAFPVHVNILEEKETAAGGTYHFDEFTADYECDVKTVIFHIKHDENPLEGAIIRLFYEERYSSILASGVTDENGDYPYVLIGDPEKMSNLFMFTVEKTDFRTKEGHFLLPLDKCAEPEEIEEEPEEVVEEPEETEEPPETVINETEEVIPEDETEDETYVPGGNETEDAGQPLEVCPFSLVLLMLLFFRSVA